MTCENNLFKRKSSFCSLLQWKACKGRHDNLKYSIHLDGQYCCCWCCCIGVAVGAVAVTAFAVGISEAAMEYIILLFWTKACAEELLQTT